MAEDNKGKYRIEYIAKAVEQLATEEVIVPGDEQFQNKRKFLKCRLCGAIDWHEIKHRLSCPLFQFVELTNAPITHFDISHEEWGSRIKAHRDGEFLKLYIDKIPVYNFSVVGAKTFFKNVAKALGEDDG